MFLRTKRAGLARRKALPRQPRALSLINWPAIFFFRLIRAGCIEFWMGLTTSRGYGAGRKDLLPQPDRRHRGRSRHGWTVGEPSGTY